MFGYNSLTKKVNFLEHIKTDRKNGRVYSRTSCRWVKQTIHNRPIPVVGFFLLIGFIEKRPTVQ